MEENYLPIKVYKLTDHSQILHLFPNYENKAEILHVGLLSSSEIPFFTTTEGLRSSLILFISLAYT